MRILMITLERPRHLAAIIQETENSTHLNRHEAGDFTPTETLSVVEAADTLCLFGSDITLTRATNADVYARIRRDVKLLQWYSRIFVPVILRPPSCGLMRSDRFVTGSRLSAFPPTSVPSSRFPPPPPPPGIATMRTLRRAKCSRCVYVIRGRRVITPAKPRDKRSRPTVYSVEPTSRGHAVPLSRRQCPSSYQTMTGRRYIARCSFDFNDRQTVGCSNRAPRRRSCCCCRRG
jgi:hypothetical protein